MHIIINCLGMPFNGETIKTQSLGGSESAAYYLARELARSHKVQVFTNCEQEGTRDGVDYLFAGRQTEAAPMGERFHFYGLNTPHDVMIIQRHHNAFAYNWASKINLWWVHDLALYRFAPTVGAMMYNVDGVLTVSQYHTDQISKVYGIDPDICFAIGNAVDLELFEGHAPRQPLEGRTVKLLYSSRPERGLEHLVKPGGVMEQLGEGYALTVVGYDNTTPDMRPYYEALWARVDELPNCRNAGALSKPGLADLMCDADLLVYPTTFEEVSCITAMEAMAAGLPMISSHHGALPETCKGAGVVLCPVDGTDNAPIADVSRYVTAVRQCADQELHDKLSGKQLEAAKDKTWWQVAERLESAVELLFKRCSRTSVLRRLIDNSDIYAVRAMPKGLSVGLRKHIEENELRACYRFMDSGEQWGEHYRGYYDYEKQRGVDYGPESLDGETRFETVCSTIQDFIGRCDSADSVRVLDYGCAHGHYTINLAKRIPGARFIGVDIAQSNIDKARAWAAAEGLENVEFYRGDSTDGLPDIEEGALDIIIAAEVLEHVPHPERVVNTLADKAREGGLFIITTPFGPWEAIGYRRHWPWRAHVHHFERSDLHDMFSAFPDFEVRTVPSGPTRTGELVGSYVTTFKNIGPAAFALHREHYARKTAQTNGRETIALCMIAKDAEASIMKTIASVADHINELIVNVDAASKDGTLDLLSGLAERWPWLRVSVDVGPSALEVGFAAARNLTLARATADWILWLDADEHMVDAHKLRRYARPNQFNGYAIKQHHMSVDPLGVLKTDMPVKLFRNNKGIKFFGMVHEHPELALNEGVGRALLIADVHIVHDSYATEEIRRGRFSRNFGLMVRDRNETPDRQLGRMLWVRDVAQMARFELEVSGAISDSTVEESRRALPLWRGLIDDNLRMAIDSLEYYSTIVTVAGCPDAVDYGFKVDTHRANGKGPDLSRGREYLGTFEDIDIARLFRERIETEQLGPSDTRYM